MIPMIIHNPSANTNGFIISFKSLVISGPQDAFLKVKNCRAKPEISDVILFHCSGSVERSVADKTILSEGLFRGCTGAFDHITSSCLTEGFFSLPMFFSQAED